jgi:Asp-tRNA(Asn)/Glu-tRNA(Gln) amidotransferase A subunit family amidase
MTLHRLGLRGLLDGLRAGTYTAEALTRDLLARIAAREPAVRAWAWLDEQRVRDSARRPAAGALGGIPVGIKDIMHVRGLPTGMGSPAFEGFIAGETATAVKRLEAAGAFVLGKTVTAELAYFHPGPTRNPWNSAHTPGGSSMGSAAAVAAGMVPLALGTQTNGSVIRPAAFCGCVGFKPSQDTIPLDGMLAFSPSLDQVGVFTRTVDDAALAVSVLADRSMALAPFAQAPRLAAVRSPVWPLAEPAAQKHFEDCLARLRRGGAKVVEVELPEAFSQAHAIQHAIMYAEGARSLADIQARHRVQLSAALNELIDEGRAIAASDLAGALAERARLQEALAAFQSDFDALVTPPARGEAPATLAHTGDPAFCTIWTLCGVPALTFPTGFGPQGLPLGLQVVGRRQDDAHLLAVAQWCARAIGFDIGFPDDGS